MSGLYGCQAKTEKEVEEKTESSTEAKGTLEIAGFMGNFEALDQVVNKTPFQNEGLDVPSDYSEFKEVLDELKKKGYVPIQGSHVHVYSDR